VQSLEDQLRKRQGTEDRLQLVENEFRTTVSQLKTQSAHMQEQAQAEISKLQGDLNERNMQILTMSRTVRQAPSPRDIGSGLQRGWNRNLALNLDQSVGDTGVVSAGLPLSRPLGKSASQGIGFVSH
jgi:hypothetical protein